MSTDQEHALRACRRIVSALGDLPFAMTVVSARLDTDFEALDYRPSSVEIVVSIGQETTTVRYPLTMSALESIVELASQLQDAIAETRAGWGMPIPRCAEHAHPLRPRITDGEARWECPAGSLDASVPIAW
jgi:hypothetical protein